MRDLRSVSSHRWTGRRCRAPRSGVAQPAPAGSRWWWFSGAGRAGARASGALALRGRARNAPPHGHPRPAPGRVAPRGRRPPVGRLSATAAVIATAAVAAAATACDGLDVREGVTCPARAPPPRPPGRRGGRGDRLLRRAWAPGQRAVVGRAREAGRARRAALGVRTDGRALRSVQARRAHPRDRPARGAGEPARSTSSSPSASDPGRSPGACGSGRSPADHERPARLAAPVIDGLVARDHRGARADQLERQRELRGGRAKQREHDVRPHVAGVLRLDAGAAQLRIHGAAHARPGDRVARVSRQHACGCAQADAARGALQAPPSRPGCTCY